MDEETRAHLATDVVVDLETLSTRPNGVVLSVGAVALRLQGGGGEPGLWPAWSFDRVLQVDCQLSWGRVIDWSTVSWWLQQDEAARKAVTVAERAVPLHALGHLRDWVHSVTVGETEVRFWGNGADFDLVLLGSLFRDCSLQPPWRYNQVRCFRTLKNLYPAKYAAAQRDIPHGGLHNALEDAMWEARVLRYLLGEAA